MARTQKAKEVRERMQVNAVTVRMVKIDNNISERGITIFVVNND